MLLFISISFFTIYLLGVFIYKGVPDSIFDSYYLLGEGKLISSLFTLLEDEIVVLEEELRNHIEEVIEL